MLFFSFGLCMMHAPWFFVFMLIGSLECFSTTVFLSSCPCLLYFHTHKAGCKCRKTTHSAYPQPFKLDSDQNYLSRSPSLVSGESKDSLQNEVCSTCFRCTSKHGMHKEEQGALFPFFFFW